jgi:hypothetical protein
MEIIVPHHTTAEKAKEAVDRSSDRLFAGIGGSSLELADQKKSWAGPVMDFSLNVKAGFISLPISGTVKVDATNVTILCELPAIAKTFVGEGKIQSAVEGRVREMLASPGNSAGD